MTSWRLHAIRHSIETEALFVSDHWRVWARTRDANGELVDVQIDAAPEADERDAYGQALDALAAKIFPCEADPGAPG